MEKVMLVLLILLILFVLWLLKPNSDNNIYQSEEDEEVKLYLWVSKKENETEFCLMAENVDLHTDEEKKIFCIVFLEVVKEIFRDLKTTIFIYNYKNYSLTDNLLSYIKAHKHPYEFGIFEHKKGISKELLTAFLNDRIDDDAGESGFFGCMATEDEIEYPHSSEEFNMLYHHIYRKNFVAKADLVDCWHNYGSITISNMLFKTEKVIEMFKRICDTKEVKINVRFKE